MKRADDGQAKLDKERVRKLAGTLGCESLVIIPSIYVFVLLATVAGLWILFGILIMLIAGGIFTSSRYEKIDIEYQDNMIPYNEIRKQARELDQKKEPIRESYKKAFKELEELRPKPSDIMKATKEYKPQPDNIVRTPELKDITCSKCGGEMTLDKSRKLLVCKFCGIAYGYTMFFGDMKQKAYEFLKEGDFAEADKKFLQVLANNPGDPDAMRGRILCAGGWRAFGEMKVTDKLTEEQLKALRERIDEAKEHFTGTDQFYPGKISLAVNYLKQYGDVPDGNDEEKSAAAEDFNSALRKLIDADREFRTRQINS